MSSSAAPDDRGASRSNSGILTESSDETLNYAVASTSAARVKRRSDTAAMERLLKPSIAVTPHPHALHVQPKMLSPLFLLRRQDLPLGCIDFRSTADEVGHTRLVESRVKILDLEARMVGAPQSVLIARRDGGARRGAVYALERQGGDDNGLYAMCRLGAWADIERLAHRATALCADRVFPSVKAEEPAATTMTTTTAPHINSLPRSKRAAIEAIQSLVRKKPKPEHGPSSDDAAAPRGMRQPLSDQTPLQPMSANAGPHVKQQTIEELPMPRMTSPRIKKREDETSTPDIPCVELGPVHTLAAETMDSKASLSVAKTEAECSANGAPSALPSTQIHAPATCDDHQDTATKIFEQIRTHYFEALYKSMGSLAYFAKGPLSRARSTFHLDLEANLDMADLVEFLKSFLLTTIQIDKKYHETAPKIISQLSATLENLDDTRSKQRKPKKMTIGKNGLYPHEDDRIRKWWNAIKPELDEEQRESAAVQIKPRLSMLRTRETQLQMILIMEILALEPLKAADDAAESGLPPLPGAAASQARRSPAAAHIKKRNKHNLPVLLDVHADRLTIWQSTAADEQQLEDGSQANGNQGQKASSSEPLKDFCTDVIVPFFSARIPDMCNAISKKLGGPVLVPAGSSKSHHRSANKKEQKPGSVTKRPAAPRPTKTLERALSTDQQSRRSVSRGPSNMIALMRSATSTSLPAMKREGGGGESANIRRLPKMEGGESQKRPAFSRSSSSLSSGAASQDASKASRKALVDAQVKDAIAALRKPNRGVVGQAMEEADQQRAFAARKARKMQRSSIVKATPVNNRFRDVFAHAQGNLETPVQQQHMSSDVIPPSSIGPLVPSTGRRIGFRNPMDLDMSPAIDPVGSTPTKRASASMFIPASSPSSASKLLLRLPGAGEGRQRPRDGDHIFATPAKKQQQEEALSASPQPQGSTKPQKSIYETLGWDDDYDLQNE